MSQVNVERVIGLMATDEAFRRRFAENPRGTLQELIDHGLVLTWCEQHALASIDLHQLQRFADAIDPRLQKTDLKGGAR